ncbi:MAG TPA: NADH-quinone oxidoreductase subunit C [Syntrophorhabdaceae bacterium]|jgi:NADH-quinone oxidoreductase subunit C
MISSNRVFEKLSEVFGRKIIHTAINMGEPVVALDKGSIREVLTFLRDDPELSYQMLVELFAIDWQGQEPRFEIVYILRSLLHNGRVTVRARCGEDGVKTVSDLWNAANWLEREAFDMFGIRFINHPELRRIYTDDDFEGFPLRKDFPLEGKDFDKPFTVHFKEEKA